MVHGGNPTTVVKRIFKLGDERLKHTIHITIQCLLWHFANNEIVKTRKTFLKNFPTLFHKVSGRNLLNAMSYVPFGKLHLSSAICDIEDCMYPHGMGEQKLFDPIFEIFND